MHRTAFSIGFTNDQDTTVCKCICMLLVSQVQAVEILKIASLNDGNCIFQTFPHISPYTNISLGSFLHNSSALGIHLSNQFSSLVKLPCSLSNSTVSSSPIQSFTFTNSPSTLISSLLITIPAQTEDSHVSFLRMCCMENGITINMFINMTIARTWCCVD